MRRAPAPARLRAAALRRQSVATRAAPLPDRRGRQARRAREPAARTPAQAGPAARAAVPEVVARAVAAPAQAARAEATPAPAARARTAALRARQTRAAVAPAHAIGRRRPPTYRRGS